MSQENVELLRRGFEAFARGDVDAVLDLADSDVEWSAGIAPILGVDATRGKDALRKFFLEDIPDGFDDFRAEPLSFEDLGDAVLVCTRYSGRGKRSGVEIAQTLFTVYVVRDGKLVSMRDYPTRAEALEGARRGG